MAVYVTQEFPIVLKDKSKPCLMTADTADELFDMAVIVNARQDQFCSDASNPFFIISRKQMKKAKVNGALVNEEAKQQKALIKRILDHKKELENKNDSN